VLGDVTLIRFAARLLLPIVLVATSMAYFQLRSQGYFSSDTSRKGRFTLRDLLVFFALIVAVIAVVVIGMRTG
jgi:hypothetical protein